MQFVEWYEYQTVFHHFDPNLVVGNLKVGRGIYSPQLQNHRDIVVYLPPSYAHSNQRYPVLYMHDGQNLFDPATSFAGEWGVDENMEWLSAEYGLEAIVVGIPNMGVARTDEYTPFVDKTHGGGNASLYIDFIADTLKPLIDASFRTLAAQRHTGLLGSSLGGLVSLYGFFYRPSTFGFAGAMSPSLWFANDAIFKFVKEAPFHTGKLYLDAGTREMGGSRPFRPNKRAMSRRYYGSVRRMKRTLIRKGYRPIHDLLHIEEQWAGHNERAWQRRLPFAVRFFLIEGDNSAVFDPSPNNS